MLPAKLEDFLTEGFSDKELATKVAIARLAHYNKRRQYKA